MLKLLLKLKNARITNTKELIRYRNILDTLLLYINYKFFYTRDIYWEYDGKMYECVPYNSEDEIVWYNGYVFEIINHIENDYYLLKRRDKYVAAESKWFKSIK